MRTLPDSTAGNGDAGDVFTLQPLQAAVRAAGPCAIVAVMADSCCFWHDCSKGNAPELPSGASA